MSLPAIVVALVGSDAPVMPFPPIVFALIAAVVFGFLAFVTWSFRDVANRHSRKTSGTTGHGTDNH